jgi:hypothetical protein
MRYLLGLAFLLLVCSCNNYGKKLKYGNSEVYYTTNVTEDLAKKLGDYLEKAQFFQADRRISVQLDKAADTFLFRMVVKKDFVNNPDYIESGKTSITELSKNVFDNKPVLVHFCDDHLKTVRIIRL